MSDTGASLPSAFPPSPSRDCRSAGGYEACFYPGFVRRLAVVEPGGNEVVLYEQTGVYYLLPGQTRPWPSSSVEFSGGGRSFSLQVNDPDQQIDRIEVTLKASTAGGGQTRVVVQDGPVLCPPICPE